nr:1326_t:CDS:2 [Entrophospora candida]
MNRRKNKKIESSRLALMEFYLEIKIADNWFPPEQETFTEFVGGKSQLVLISSLDERIWDILDDGIKKEFQRICSSVDELFKNKRKNQPLQINFYQAPSSPSSSEQSTNNNNEESVNTEDALTEIEKTVFNELFIDQTLTY